MKMHTKDTLLLISMKTQEDDEKKIHSQKEMIVHRFVAFENIK